MFVFLFVYQSCIRLSLYIASIGLFYKREFGSDQVGVTAVAPGISEALVATAAGLMAAIPALMGYNYFRNQARVLTNTMRNYGMELTNRFEWIVHGKLLGRE